MTPSRMKERGQAMIMSTVFFIVISTAILTGLSAMTAGSERFAASVTSAERALYLGQEVTETAAYDLMHNLPLSGIPVVSGYTVSRDVANVGANKRITTSVSWGRSTRIIEMLVFASSTDSEILSWREIREE